MYGIFIIHRVNSELCGDLDGILVNFAFTIGMSLNTNPLHQRHHIKFKR